MGAAGHCTPTLLCWSHVSLVCSRSCRKHGPLRTTLRTLPSGWFYASCSCSLENDYMTLNFSDYSLHPWKKIQESIKLLLVMKTVELLRGNKTCEKQGEQNADYTSRTRKLNLYVIIIPLHKIIMFNSKLNHSSPFCFPQSSAHLAHKPWAQPPP